MDENEGIKADEEKKRGSEGLRGRRGREHRGERKKKPIVLLI